MAIDMKKKIGVNTKIANVFNFVMPYQWLSEENASEVQKSFAKKKVIFFGNDMSGILDLGNVDKDLLVSKTNACLDYVRRFYGDYDLYYKPHPARDTEIAAVNLTGFKILRENTTAELFLWKHKSEIRAVFGITSLSTFNAFNLGIDAHVFYKCFSKIYSPNWSWYFDDMYFGMPGSFFIENFNQLAVDNTRVIEMDEALELLFKKVLQENKGKVWLICSFSESMILLIALSKIIRSLSPGRKINLIINRSHRWDSIDARIFSDSFDEVISIPRIHYSVKPSKVLQAIKIAWRIKNINVLPDDLVMSVSQPEFIENCFISYHKKNLHIGVLTSSDFNAQYNPDNISYTRNKDFRFNKATRFYNYMLEPLLGLNRTMYLTYTKWKGFYLNRYQKPINEVFNQVWLFSHKQ